MSSVDKIKKKYEKSEESIKEFTELLESLDNLQDKKKLLWLQIYENALNDRESAGLLFADLYKSVNSPSAHTTVGPMMTKYLERMSKSNEQILKLAELISREETKSSKISADDLFEQIGND